MKKFLFAMVVVLLGANLFLGARIYSASVEKADKEVLNVFYQVFDKGMLADGEGRLVDFKNTVIILTSNLATDLITNAAPPGEEAPALEDLVSLAKPTLTAHFKPARSAIS